MKETILQIGGSLMTDQEKQRIAVMRSTGKSYKEIAKTLKLSLNTVQTLLSLV